MLDVVKLLCQILALAIYFILVSKAFILESISLNLLFILNSRSSTFTETTIAAATTSPKTDKSGV